MGRPRVVGVLAGYWALALFISSAAYAGQPRAAQVAATQRAVITARPFAADESMMKNPQVARVLSPTMVSATFTNTRALDAFAELAKLSGYVIEPYNAGAAQTRYSTVTATIQNQPFWAAMREVCTRANVGLYYYGDDDPDKIQLMPTNYGQQHMLKAAASIQGPYLTIVTNLERVNAVMMATPEHTQRTINIQIHTFAEPKARPTQYAYQPVIEEAVDNNGNSMMPQDERQQHMQSTRGLAWYGFIQLPYPMTNPGTKIARLRGYIDAKVQLQSEPVEIDKPLEARDVARTVGGKKVTFKSMTKDGPGRYTAEIVYHRGNNEDQQDFRQNAFAIEPVVKVSDSGRGSYQIYSTGASSDGQQVTRRYQVQRRSGSQAAGATDPDKLVIEVPTATQDVAIPFELVDLPLP